MDNGIKAKVNDKIAFNKNTEVNGPFNLRLTLECEQRPNNIWFWRGMAYACDSYFFETDLLLFI